MPDGHDHVHGTLSLADRHAHEAETYDAIAAGILATWVDGQHRVSKAHIPFPNREHRDFLTDAVERLGPLNGRRILEVGAGCGSLSIWLALQGAEVVGIDVSEGVLQVARRTAVVNEVAERVTFVRCPIESFDPAAVGLDHQVYDGIIGNNVLHHFDRPQAMANLARLLAPGAVAVFCEPVLLLPEWTRRLRNSAPVAHRFPLHTHSPDERSLDLDDFDEVRRWFHHFETRSYQLTCRLQNFRDLSDATWERLESLDRLILRRIPATRRLARFVVITLGLPRERPAS